jgi:hypothetical protein
MRNRKYTFDELSTMAETAMAEERELLGIEAALERAARRLSAVWQDERSSKEARETAYRIGTRLERDHLAVKAQRESVTETIETLASLALAAELAEAPTLVAEATS